MSPQSDTCRVNTTTSVHPSGRITFNRSARTLTCPRTRSPRCQETHGQRQQANLRLSVEQLTTPVHNANKKTSTSTFLPGALSASPSICSDALWLNRTGHSFASSQPANALFTTASVHGRSFFCEANGCRACPNFSIRHNAANTSKNIRSHGPQTALTHNLTARQRDTTQSTSCTTSIGHRTQKPWHGTPIAERRNMISHFAIFIF